MRIFGSSLISAILLSSSLYACPTSLPQVSWEHMVVSKKGKEYRKVEVEFIKVEKEQVVLPDERVYFESYASPEGYVSVKLKNKSGTIIKDIIIAQKIERSFDSFVKVKRIISRSPLIVEDYLSAPYNMERNTVYIGLPKLGPNEEVVLEYKVSSGVVYSPKLLSPVVKIERKREWVVNKYVFYFKAGETRIEEKAFERLAMYVHLLPYGDNYMIKVKGFADATGKSHINERLARERAENLVKLLTQNNLACIEKKTYAGNLTGTDLEAR